MRRSEQSYECQQSLLSPSGNATYKKYNWIENFVAQNLLLKFSSFFESFKVCRRIFFKCLPAYFLFFFTLTNRLALLFIGYHEANFVVGMLLAGASIKLIFRARCPT